MAQFRYGGPAFGAAATLVAGALAAATFTAAPALAATPASATAAAKSVAAPKAPKFLSAAQATLQARQSGKPVVATALTTPTAQTVANPDGTVSLTQTVTPTRVFQKGAWVSLDGTLKANADGTFSPAATSDQVVLSGGGTGPLTRMYAGGQGFTVTLPIALPHPTVTGDTAVYAQVIPGVDLTVTVAGNGEVSDVFTVRNAAAAHDPRLAQLMNATTTPTRGLHLAADTAGDLAIADAKGRAVFTAPSPTAWDSATAALPKAAAGRANSPIDPASNADGPGFAAHRAHLGVKATGGHVQLTTPATLTGTAVAYPLYIDPVWTLGTGTLGWTSVGSAVAGDNYWNGTVDAGTGDSDAEVGNSNSVQGEAMSLFNLPVPTQLKGTNYHIYSANFGITENYSWACPTSGHDQYVNLYAPSSTLAQSNATWNNWVNNLGSQIGHESYAMGQNSSCPGGGIPAYPLSTTFVANDIQAGKKTQTFALRADDGTDPYAFKEFTPSSAQWTINFDQYPNTPTGLSTSPFTNCNGTTTLGDTSVTLYAPVSTPTNVSLTTTFSLYKTSDSNKTNLLTSANGISSNTYKGASGQDAVLVLPESFFAKQAAGAATGFGWSVSTTDGTLSASSSACSFTWDPTRPGTPGVAVMATTNGAQSCATRGDTTDAIKPIGSTCQFTLTPPTQTVNGTSTPTAISGYIYQVNQQPPVTVDTNASATTVSVQLTHLVNTLTVSALSAGGNLGTPNVVWFDGTAITPAAKDGDLTLDGTPDLIVTGNTGSVFGPGLWLAQGNSDGTVTRTPANIGIDGLGFNTAATPTDWNGSQAVSGGFCGYGAQDVLAYFPSGTHGGGASVLCNDGSGAPLHLGLPTADLTANAPFQISAQSLTDTAGDNATQIVTGGNTSGKGTGLPDLIGTAGNQLYVYWSTTANGYGVQFNSCSGACDQLTALNSPDGTQDWNSWTVATAQLSSGTAMYLWNKTTGALDLWTGLAVDSTGTTLTTTGQYTIATGWNTNPSDNLVLRAADIAGSGVPGLWVTDTTTGSTTATLPSALANSPTLTTASTPLQTSAHEWNFQDVGANAPGSQISSTSDNPSGSATALNLSGTAGATWNTGDMFSPDANLNGTNGSLGTSAPAVTTSQDFTVSAWVDPQSIGSGGAAILSQDGAKDSGFVLFAGTTGWSVCMAKTDAGPWNDDCASSHAPVRLGSWTHVAATYNHTTGELALYVNGVSASATTHTAVAGFTGGFQVGRDLLNGAGNAYFGGSVSQVQSWNQTLTPAQAYAVYAGSIHNASGATVFSSDGTLYPSGSSWTHGVETLAFNQGLLTVSTSGTELFSAGASGYPGAVFTLQSDGNMVIYDTAADANAHTNALWASGTYNNPSVDVGDAALFQPDGNLVIYDVSGTPLWASNTSAGGSNRWQLNGSGQDDAGVNAATPTNVTYGADHLGTAGAAANFDGSTSVIRAAAPAFDTTSSYSVSAWVKLNNLSSTQTVVSEGTNNHQAFYLGYYTTTNSWYFMTSTSDTPTTNLPVASGGWAQVGQWTHLTGVYDVSAHTMTLYVNGVSVGTATNTTPVASVGPLQIGANSAPATPTSLYNQTNGSISDVRTFPIALNATQALMDTGMPDGQSHYNFADTVDWYGNGTQDIVAADSSGNLWVTPTGQHTSNPVRTQIGQGWTGYTFAGVADLNKDGHLDVIARDANGLLWVYPGDANHDLKTPRVQIGSGWNGYSFAGVRDWNGDGNVDVVAKDSNGALWMYPGTGTINGMSTLGSRVQIGTNWQTYTLDGMVDWNKDGHMDLVATDSNGALWVYPGDAAHDTSGTRVQIGSGFNSSSYTILGLADVTGDGNADVVTRSPENDLYVYAGNGQITTTTLGTPRSLLGVNW